MCGLVPLPSGPCAGGEFCDRSGSTGTLSGCAAELASSSASLGPARKAELQSLLQQPA